MIWNLTILAFLFAGKQDTLCYPIFGGQVIRYENQTSLDHDFSVSITPVSDFDVKSCSSGLVIGIKKDSSDVRSNIFIKSDRVVFSYTLDFVSIKKGDTVNTGQKIGELEKFGANQKKSTSNLICCRF